MLSLCFEKIIFSVPSGGGKQKAPFDEISTENAFWAIGSNIMIFKQSSNISILKKRKSCVSSTF